jgi:Cu+-exporting ATPase
MKAPASSSPASAPGQVELTISGMTCASCASRVERKLNKLDGVSASVNYATEKARVRYPEGLDPAELVAAVAAAGYTARLPEPPRATPDQGVAEDPLRLLRQRLVVCALLSIPVIALAMVSAWQFTYWQWLSLSLAAPVVIWGGYPFHRAAWTNLRHATSTMDTLVSIGTLAALGWSIYALFLGSAGEPGMTHPFELTIARSEGSANIYLEAAAGVTTFLLAGRYLEARSKRTAGAALRALLELGAKEVAVLRGGIEERISVEALGVGDEFVVRPGEKVAADGTVLDGSSAVDASMLTGESKWPQGTPWSAAPSTPEVGSWSGPAGSAPTPNSRRWRAWSRKHSTARHRHNAWPTGSRASSCPPSSPSRWRPWVSGWAPAPEPRPRSPPRWRS